MPVYVDHAKRRAELIEVAIELIAESGLEGASVRSIASRAGYSAVVVAHYFRNKSELLRQAFERTIELTGVRIDEAISAGSDVLATLEIMLPTEPVSSKTWKVWFAFWGAALSEPAYQMAQATRGREGREIIKRVLDQCSAIPLGAAGGREVQSARLLALIAGIAAIATFDPELWQPEFQRRILRSELDDLRNSL
ncbi:TetR/AcrR family transcriptional regulator [Novosphingobium sp. KN65.2]|uniref:TetR/AcrR family transcriptional regulator n=1 Tax=Novosphingobium sp. KN65.2 TaxID=1478134 RepID=UPI0005E56DC2|nr:TetR/AcrR family transcriptional regulator [Novosphingobium sp. KN65.2]CDO38595.1 putative Transcriptional regulator, TetR family [Novosphingobium sp. KN65.2]